MEGVEEVFEDEEGVVAGELGDLDGGGAAVFILKNASQIRKAFILTSSGCAEFILLNGN
jgi:hypothetical protein